MNDEIVPWDIGGFNPRFLGISLRVGSRRALDLVWKAMIGSSVDPDGLSEIALISTLHHEVRHYHDFLISPYAATVFRMRLQAMWSGTLALVFARELAGTHLPVPIGSWMSMNESLREVTASGWRSDGWLNENDVLCTMNVHGDLRGGMAEPTRLGMDLSRPAPELFDISSILTSSAYRNIETLAAGFVEGDTGLIPALVYEATALTCQIRAIAQDQSNAAAIELIRYLLQAQVPYAVVWRALLSAANLLEERSSTDAADWLGRSLSSILAMATWCLLGSYEAEGKAGCPALRCRRLLDLIEQDEDERSDEVGRLWDRWDKKLSGARWRVSLERLLAYGERGAQLYRDTARENVVGKDALDLVVSVFAAYLAQQQVAVQKLLADPATFGSAAEYVNAPGLPLPLVRIFFDGFIMPVEDLAPDCSPVEPMRYNGLSCAGGFMLPTRPDRSALREQALDLETRFMTCDIAFSNHAIPWQANLRHRASLQILTGKRALSILTRP